MLVTKCSYKTDNHVLDKKTKLLFFYVQASSFQVGSSVYSKGAYSANGHPVLSTECSQRKCNLDGYKPCDVRADKYGEGT